MARSVAFDELLGLTLPSSHREDGRLVSAFVTGPADEPTAAEARLMLAVADEPVDPALQAVLFNRWTPDARGLREQLVRAGVDVGPISIPSTCPPAS